MRLAEVEGFDLARAEVYAIVVNVPIMFGGAEAKNSIRAAAVEALYPLSG